MGGGGWHTKGLIRPYTRSAPGSEVIIQLLLCSVAEKLRWNWGQKATLQLEIVLHVLLRGFRLWKWKWMDSGASSFQKESCVGWPCQRTSTKDNKRETHHCSVFFIYFTTLPSRHKEWTVWWHDNRLTFMTFWKLGKFWSVVYFKLNSTRDIPVLAEEWQMLTVPTCATGIRKQGICSKRRELTGQNERTKSWEETSDRFRGNRAHQQNAQPSLLWPVHSFLLAPLTCAFVVIEIHVHTHSSPKNWTVCLQMMRHRIYFRQEPQIFDVYGVATSGGSA